jgi:hypothetical protein
VPALRQAFRIGAVEFVRLIEQEKSFNGIGLKERKLWCACIAFFVMGVRAGGSSDGIPIDGGG